MKNAKVTNVRYSKIDSIVSGHQEIVVTFNWNGVAYRRVLLIKQGKNVNYLNEARKIIDKEINDGTLVKKAKKGTRQKKTAVLTSLLVASTVAACTFAGLFTYMYLKPTEQPDVPPLSTVTISFTDDTKNNATIDKTTMNIGGTLEAKITMTKVGTAIDETRFTVTSSSTLTPEVDYTLKWRAISPTVPKEYDFKILNGEKITKDVIISAPLKEDTPTTIEIDSDSVDKIKFDATVTPIIGKNYENDFLLLQPGSLDDANPCTITSNGEPLTLNDDFKIKKVTDGKYHLTIYGEKITGPIVISNVLILNDDEYAIVFDSTSSSQLSISPSVGKKGEPYSGTITIDGKANRINLDNFTVKIGTEGITDYECAFHMPLTDKDQYDLTINQNIDKTVTIHAELLEMDRTMDATRFAEAIDFSNIEYLQSYSPNVVENSLVSNRYTPDVYYKQCYYIDQETWTPETYCIKQDGDTYIEYIKEASIGAWIETESYESDFHTPDDDDGVSLLGQLNDLYKQFQSGDSLFSALTLTPDGLGYCCDDPFVGTQAAGLVNSVELRFGNSKLLYLKIVGSFNGADEGTQTMESSYNYDTNPLTLPELTDVNYQIEDDTIWTNALRFTIGEDEVVEIGNYRYKGSNLYRIPDSNLDSKYIYFEKNENEYHKYMYNSTSMKYEKLDSTETEFNENNFENRRNQVFNEVFLDKSKFNYSIENKTYTAQNIGDYATVTLEFMNDKVAHVQYRITDWIYVDVNRSGLELTPPKI